MSTNPLVPLIVISHVWITLLLQTMINYSRSCELPLLRITTKVVDHSPFGKVTFYMYL